MITDAVLQFLAAFFGTIAFSVLFSVPKEHYPLCGVIGGTGWLICWALIHVLHVGVVEANFVATVFITLASRIVNAKTDTGQRFLFQCPITVL